MENTDSPTPADPPKPKHAKKILFTVLYLCFLATLCFVAYQVRLMVTSQNAQPVVARGDAPHRQPPPGAMPQLPVPPTTGPWQPDLAHRPASSPIDDDPGLRQFDGDPGDYPPPPDATSKGGFERMVMGQVSQQQTYEFPGEIQAAKEYYVKLFANEGFSMFQDKMSTADTVVLTFLKDQTQVSLSLRKDPQQVKMVRIILVVTSD